MNICPNCGAPVTAEKCEYCGAVFLDFAAIQVGAPSYVKFKIGSTYICARLVVTRLDIEQQTETKAFTDALGVKVGEVAVGWGCDFHMDAHAVQDPYYSSEPLVTIIETE